MTAKIVKFYPANAAKDPDNVLEQAVGEYDGVFVIGWDKDGGMDFRASTNMTAQEILFLIESFKAKLLAGDYFED